MDFNQLWPAPDTVEGEAFIAGLGLSERALPERPYSVVNFVSSLDGRTTFAGRSGALGDVGDKAMFRALRGAADALMVGAGTLRAERYGRVLSDPQARERRRAQDRAPEPLLVTLTHTGHVPLDIPLFAEPEARVLVFTTGAEVDASAALAQVEVVRLEAGASPLTSLLHFLRAERDVRSLLCEGGPTVFGGLLQESLVDELFLTLAPRFTGGGNGPAISSGPELPELAGARLAGVLEREDTLFLRYLCSPPATSSA